MFFRYPTPFLICRFFYNDYRIFLSTIPTCSLCMDGASSSSAIYRVHWFLLLVSKQVAGLLSIHLHLASLWAAGANLNTANALFICWHSTDLLHLNFCTNNNTLYFVGKVCETLLQNILTHISSKVSLHSRFWMTENNALQQRPPQEYVEPRSNMTIVIKHHT